MAHRPKTSLPMDLESEVYSTDRTVIVGQHMLKITGSCCDLVKLAKFVLEDYFSGAEFLSVVKASSQISLEVLNDSGIDCDVVCDTLKDTVASDENNTGHLGAAASTKKDIVQRSRRSHFSRFESTFQAPAKSSIPRIGYKRDYLMLLAKSPLSLTFPGEWKDICKKAFTIVRQW